MVGKEAGDIGERTDGGERDAARRSRGEGPGEIADCVSTVGLARGWGQADPAETIRAVAVYAGRTIPAIPRRRDLPPGIALITPSATYTALAESGVVAAPLLVGEGRVGNTEHGAVVLAETRR